MTEPLRYEITGVAGIDHAELELRPGVSILRGANGAGKTSAIRAIAKSQGGNVELERRDGVERGRVVAPSATLTVGKVVRRKDDGAGVAGLSLADVGPVSRLIDPGFKDSESAARARIRALIELLGVSVDDEAVETLAQGDAHAAAWLAQEVQEESVEGLDDAAGRLKRHLEGRAREKEREAESASGRADAAREQGAEALEALGGEAGLEEETGAAAREALMESHGRYARAEAECEAREALEARQAELRATMGERPDTAEAQAALEQAQARHQTATDQVADLEGKLQAAKAERDAAAEAVQQWSDRLEVDSATAARWDEAQAVLDQEPTGPTREELARLREELVEAPKRRLERAERSDAYRRAEEQRIAAEEARQLAAREAQALRDRAKAIPSQLGEILARAGAPGLTVVDGRLHALVDGEPRDWERRLSDGQRVRAALDVAAHVYGAGSVVQIDGRYWTSLDPDAKRHLATLAAERSLYAVTEEATEGALRVESMEST